MTAMTRKSELIAAAPPAALPKLPTSTRGPTIVGLVILILAVGGFGSWAALAPLSSAALAPGVVVMEGSRKTVQHLEGGIIKDILVSEGSAVAAGDVLVRLDETGPRTLFDLLRGQYLAAIALEARLSAERDLLQEVRFPAELLAERDDAAVAEILAGQQRLFETRRRSLQGQIDILRQRGAQYDEEVSGLNAQLEATQRQIVLIREELKIVKDLYEKGHETKRRVLALERAMADLRGERGELISDIARVKQRIGETELRIIDLENAFQREVAGLLREVQTDVSELNGRLHAQEYTLQRLDIRAPQAGVVVGLKVHTTDGVIAPGMPILDIVPSEDRMIIEARVSPHDIDVVYPGLAAQVRLTAYKRRTTPMIYGKVIHVSADRFVDDKSGIAYYLAKIEVDMAALETWDDVHLYPGMPADVMIETGKRTALEYLISPITNSIHRAFREQ